MANMTTETLRVKHQDEKHTRTKKPEAITIRGQRKVHQIVCVHTLAGMSTCTGWYVNMYRTMQTGTRITTDKTKQKTPPWRQSSAALIWLSLPCIKSPAKRNVAFRSDKKTKV